LTYIGLIYISIADSMGRHLKPSLWRTPCEYLHIPRNYRLIGLYFSRGYFWSIFIQIFAVCSKIRIFSATECVSAVQGHPRSILIPIESACATSY